MNAPTTHAAAPGLRVHPYNVVHAMRPAAELLGDYVVPPLDEYVQGQAELLAAQSGLPESVAAHIQGLLRWAAGEDDRAEACAQLGEALVYAVTVLRTVAEDQRETAAPLVTAMAAEVLGMVPEHRPSLQGLALYLAAHGR